MQTEFSLSVNTYIAETPCSAVLLASSYALAHSESEALGIALERSVTMAGPVSVVSLCLWSGTIPCTDGEIGVQGFVCM